ncbi:MAG: hypothetical protein KHZ58_00315 [Hungatella hathewayi]|nr:hypothetical protein [Hungatella hathewayi]
MKDRDILLCSDDLEVTVLNPEDGWPSQRFALPGVVKQVTLHGKHVFCQPEQKKAERVTCHGVGLCGEFVWDELAKEAKPGQWFPKAGVGLMRQRPEGGTYDMWKSYECQRFPVTWEQTNRQQAVFFQRQEPCLGVAANLTRTVSVYRNTVTVTTELKNTGERTLNLREYQHNFLAIDERLMGPGYHLKVPFDGTLGEMSESTVKIEDYNCHVDGVLQVSGNVMGYRRDMEGTACHKVTEENEILFCPEYRWTLYHEESPAKVSETVHFRPKGLVIWGIEHCICAEVYDEWKLEPGERRVSARTWRFEDEVTGT